MDKEYKFAYEQYDSPEGLPESDRSLVDKAREACFAAYAPYSGFRVGAAARLASGAVVTSSNQESAVFPAGICAERNLLSTWQSNHAGDPIQAIAIASIPGQRECYPCGICRQVLCDTEQRQGEPIRIIMAGDRSASAVTTAASLMPFTFKLKD